MFSFILFLLNKFLKIEQKFDLHNDYDEKCIQLNYLILRDGMIFFSCNFNKFTCYMNNKL